MFGERISLTAGRAMRGSRCGKPSCVIQRGFSSEVRKKTRIILAIALEIPGSGFAHPQEISASFPLTFYETPQDPTKTGTYLTIII